VGTHILDPDGALHPLPFDDLPNDDDRPPLRSALDQGSSERSEADGAMDLLPGRQAGRVLSRDG
jgi:hypothetical protein